MAIPEWFDWMAGVASVLGLVAAGLAYWQAGGAKLAAEKTEKSVTRHNAEVDFASLARMAKELHGYIENGKTPEARVRTTDLRSDLALAISVHEVFLGAQFSQLKEKQVDLALVTEGLNRKAGEMSQTERVRLLGITGAILELLAGQCGKLRSSVEKGESNG
jgi:hypothetical protein